MGFLVSALVIYLAQFIVGGVSVSVLGALLAALVIGIIDLFIPISTLLKQAKPANRNTPLQLEDSSGTL